MDSSINNSLAEKIKGFKKKLMIQATVKGGLLFTSVLISYFIVLNIAEQISYFSSAIRLSLFISFLSLFAASLYYWVIKPLVNFNKKNTEETLANMIGNRIPTIQDKLLNAIILRKSLQGELALANYDQKSTDFKHINFSDSIQISENRNLFIAFLLPLLFILAIAIYDYSLIYDSSSRIIHYNTEFSKPAPYSFKVLNNDLKVFENESLKVEISVEGSLIPSNIYLAQGNLRRIMKTNELGNYELELTQITNNQSFTIESGEIQSKIYNIQVLKRPLLKQTEISISYPAYLQIQNESAKNSTNLTVPEGTKVNYTFLTSETNTAIISESEETGSTSQKSNNIFSFENQYSENTSFALVLKNKHGSNKTEYNYYINVVKDQYPTITTANLLDTNYFQNILLTGSISDDYGLKSLKLHYTIQEGNKTIKQQQLSIPINKLAEQNFIFNWQIDTLLSNNQSITYYLEVKDNDLPHGYKSTKTSIAKISLPNKEKAELKIEKTQKTVGEGFNKDSKKADQLKNKLSDLQDKLKSKKSLSWEDKKELEDILKQHEKLQKSIDELSKNLENLKSQQNKFNKKNKDIIEKQEKLQKLMDNVLDEETKKLLKELEKLLNNKKAKPEHLLEKLDKLEQTDSNLEKELERALELFKKLKFEQKVENTIDKLDKLQQKQKEEANKADKSLEKQDQLNKEFDEVKKDIDELKKLNEESESKQEEELEKLAEDSKDVQSSQSKSSENIKGKSSKKASQSQKDAAQKMDDMKNGMQSMLSQMQEEEQEEDFNNLRRILDNLVKISYDQENLLKIFKKLNKVNPQFVEQSAQQIKIKKNAKILEDSLLALAGRVFEIESIVTKELFLMNEHLDGSLKSIRDRKIGKITNNQQFAMTSMNNLALLLSEVSQKMQQKMSQCMKGNQNCSKPGGKKPSQSKGIGKLQKALSGKIKEMKKSGEQGKSASESFAKMAAEQGKLKQALKEMEKMMEKGKQGNGNMGKLDKLMEENEIDLLNKRITQETINRQQEILTKLLEAEKSLREREWDDKRESNTATQNNNSLPPDIQEYLNKRNKEIEQLKTISPNFSPYYKVKVGEYFKVN